jgi:hypothetical protein
VEALTLFFETAGTLEVERRLLSEDFVTQAHVGHALLGAAFPLMGTPGIRQKGVRMSANTAR